MNDRLGLSGIYAFKMMGDLLFCIQTVDGYSVLIVKGRRGRGVHTPADLVVIVKADRYQALWMTMKSLFTR